MDAAKLDVLESIGYEISACGTCVHAEISAGTDWGVCGLYTYDHGKHTGAERQLSINRHGRCAAHEPSDTARAELHGFVAFLGRRTT